MSDLAPLSSAQLTHLQKWLTEKTKRAECEVCESNNWGIAPHLVSSYTISADNGDVHLGGAQYPQVIVYCHTCGHVRPFMAIPTGVMNVPEGKEAIHALGNASD